MPTFLAHLLFIRLKQAGRAVWGVGALLLIAIPLALILLFVLWDGLAGLKAWQLTAIISLLFLSLHGQRKDLNFLQKCGQPVPIVLLVEYQLALLFLSIPVLLLSGHWPGIAMAHLAVACLAFVPVPQKSGDRRAIRLNWLPADNLEWKSGVRRHWRLLLPVYLAGLFLSFYIPGVLLSVAVILMISLGFYDELESRTLLERALQPHFLWKKWSRHYGLFCLLFAPQIMLYLIFHFQYWYFLAFVLAVAGVFLGCAIFYKYSAYLPARRRANNQTSMSIMFMSLIVPFLAPLSLIAFFVLHRKARQRLQYFFPDA